jgi:hypothetical protein
MEEEAGIKPRLFDFRAKNRGEPLPSPIIFLSSRRWRSGSDA